ncbi:MAG: SPFH domain-containing protein [Lachnospiraceae bacterium]|nr:SPFH domain-containing protein [Lachnospiraceae bacterium]
MGLISAALGAAGGVLADQWKEYFYCEALPSNVIVTKGKKKVSDRSSNTKGSDNVISNGSVIAVADGQCMIIVDQGAIVDLCAEPGEYVYDMSSEPSLFDGGNLGSNIKAVFAEFGKRFTFGGEVPKDQRVYYFNTKEMMGNKYGTPNSVPFRVVDTNIGLDMDVNIKCFGEYSYKVTNPMLFYKNVCGNVSSDYTRGDIEGQLKTEFMTHLQEAFALIGDKGIRYSSLPGHAVELADALNEVLSAKWKDQRGIEIVSVGVSSVKADEEDEKMLKELQRNAVFRNGAMANAQMVGATSQAMVDAANNASGAAVGLMGMNMTQNLGAANMYAYNQAQPQAAQTAPAAAAADGWTCSCGTVNTGKFCSNCGTPKPVADTWTCSCGTVNTGKFCSNCGTPKPAADTWTCECGTVNTGKFCSECGKPQA